MRSTGRLLLIVLGAALLTLAFTQFAIITEQFQLFWLRRLCYAIMILRIIGSHGLFGVLENHEIWQQVFKTTVVDESDQFGQTERETLVRMIKNKELDRMLVVQFVEEILRKIRQ